MNATATQSPNPIAAAPAAVVQAQNLHKTYRTGFWMNQKISSLKGVSLSVHQGETFGLLGPNGAGKTTLLKILLGITRPSQGSGSLLGKPLGDRAVRAHLGYLPENPYFYDYLTGWEMLRFTAGLFGIPEAEQRKRMVDLLDWVGLAQSTARKKPLREYSKGMLQRLGLAQALINNPDLIFLDEPMSGLDPQGRYQMREIILTLKSQGKTIFFNSHILADVEKICDRVAILAQGNLLCAGSLDELLGTSRAYEIKVEGDRLNLEVLAQWVDHLKLDDTVWSGQLKGKPEEFLGSLSLMGGRLLSLQLTRPSLEEFFVEQLRQRNIRVSE
ncbi:MAG: ABC transporter ATP-binding protein [Prochlorothrix sp.]|nr:ABC transporter ATP-binding protein [Prochlorothrix sp.]